MILFSALQAIYQAVLKMIHPEPITNLGWVTAAAILGFFGNEMVAVFRIRVGKQIGSAALVADGYHARTDGFTSLAVLAGAAGVWFGFPLLDPIIGILIGAAILVIVWNSARDMFYRITVNCELTTHESHHIAEEVRHALYHALPALVDVTVHVDPCECEVTRDAHHHTTHHVVTTASL